MPLQPRFINSQKGATLIVVLMLLILIVLAGVISVRNSSTDLRLATASQVNSLLFIAAEQPNTALEQMSSGNDVTAPSGPIGYFMDNPVAANDELLYCFRPKQTQPLLIFKAAILDANRGSVATDKACQVNRPADYTSSRNATMVQTAFTQGVAPIKTPLATGIDLAKGNTKGYSINVDSIATIPSYGSASNSELNDCFAKPITKSKTSTAQTAGECLTDKGVPNKGVTQNYVVQYQEKDPVSSTTLSTGSGGGGGAGNDEGEDVDGEDVDGEDSNDGTGDDGADEAGGDSGDE